MYQSVDVLQKFNEIEQKLCPKNVIFKTAALKRRLVHSWDHTDLTHHISPKWHFVSNNDSGREIQLSNLKQGASDSNLAKRIQRTCHVLCRFQSRSFKKSVDIENFMKLLKNPSQSPNKIRNSKTCTVHTESPMTSAPPQMHHSQGIHESHHRKRPTGNVQSHHTNKAQKLNTFRSKKLMSCGVASSGIT